VEEERGKRKKSTFFLMFGGDNFKKRKKKKTNIVFLSRKGRAFFCTSDHLGWTKRREEGEGVEL